MKAVKKKIIIIAVVILLLFAPFFRIDYDDGGTIVHAALAYKIVRWKTYVPIYDENGEEKDLEIYQATRVYWFPKNFKSIDDLWDLEEQSIGK